MSIEFLFRSFQTSLQSIDESARTDFERIRKSLDNAQLTLSKSSDSLEIWTVGAEIACIQSESSCILPNTDAVEILKLSSIGIHSKSLRDASNTLQKQEAAPQVVQKKTVSFHPNVAVSEDSRAAETPKTASKVRGMLSVWEDKIQKVTTPHYGKTPLSCVREETEPMSGLKRKHIPLPEPYPEQAVDETFDGPILEIPDDLLAELEGLDPAAREKRLSVLQIEIDDRRKSITIKEPSPNEEPVVPFAGRVAAALKLFAGTTVPKRDFGVVSFSSKKAPPLKEPAAMNVDEASLDGEELDDINLDNADKVKFYDAQEKGVLDLDLESSEDEKDPEISHLHQVEAAQEVAQLEAAEEELERSTWLADIEEIKLVTTPAKPGKSEAVGGDWSAVSQKMNLSCHLTPVVPGRRSCVAFQPLMIALGPKVDDEQYEVTDKDTDSESELSPNSRSKKHIPSWCVNWRQKAIAQIAVDPESIFGVTVPKCELDIIFTQHNYQQMGLHRPKRARGSSGNWTFDKLTQDEVDRYRAKLGQVVRAEGVFIYE